LKKLLGIHAWLESGAPEGPGYYDRASLRATPGWHVFDSDGNTGHCSAGTVIEAADPDVATFFAGGGFNQYNGPWEIWDGFDVEL
jgi:hypothetical protein